MNMNEYEYVVREVFPNGDFFVRFRNCDRFECEVWLEHHKYDYEIINSHSHLIITED